MLKNKTSKSKRNFNRKKKGKTRRSNASRDLSIYNKSSGLPTTIVPRNRGFQNPREIVTLSYHDVVSSGALAAGSILGYSFAPNGPYDFDRTGGGHQPNGYDELAARYLRYLPLNTKYKFIVPVLADACMITVSPFNSVFPTVNNLQTFNDLSELPGAKCTSLNYGGGGPPGKISGNIDFRSLNGSSKYQYYGDDRFGALFSARPAEGFDLVIAFNNVGGVTQTFKFTVILEITMEVYDPISSDPSFKEYLERSEHLHEALHYYYQENYKPIRDLYFKKKNQTFKEILTDEPTAMNVRVLQFPSGNKN